MVTDGEEDAVSPDGGQQLLNEEDQQDGADGGQEEVVEHERGVELEWRILLHDLAATEDDNIVGDEHDHSGLEGGKRSLPFHELELAGGIAEDGLEGLVEDGPQVNAEGAIQSWQGDLLQEVCHGDCYGVQWTVM